MKHVSIAMKHHIQNSNVSFGYFDAIEDKTCCYLLGALVTHFKNKICSRSTRFLNLISLKNQLSFRKCLTCSKCSFSFSLINIVDYNDSSAEYFVYLVHYLQEMGRAVI